VHQKSLHNRGHDDRSQFRLHTSLHADPGWHMPLTVPQSSLRFNMRTPQVTLVLAATILILGAHYVSAARPISGSSASVPPRQVRALITTGHCWSVDSLPESRGFGKCQTSFFSCMAPLQINAPSVQPPNTQQASDLRQPRHVHRCLLQDGEDDDEDSPGSPPPSTPSDCECWGHSQCMSYILLPSQPFLAQALLSNECPCQHGKLCRKSPAQPRQLFFSIISLHPR
jgi:hypothetical protein